LFKTRRDREHGSFSNFFLLAKKSDLFLDSFKLFLSLVAELFGVVVFLFDLAQLVGYLTNFIQIVLNG
jgi:hypothetical protein